MIGKEIRIETEKQSEILVLDNFAHCRGYAEIFFNSMPFQLLPEQFFSSFLFCWVWDVSFHLVAASFQVFSKINDSLKCCEQQELPQHT